MRSLGPGPPFSGGRRVTWSAVGISELSNPELSQRSLHLSAFTSDLFHRVPRGNVLSYYKKIKINCWKTKENSSDSISWHKITHAKIQVKFWMIPGGPGRLTGLSRGVLVCFSLTWGSGGRGESWGEPSWSLGFLGTLHWFPRQGEQLLFPLELVQPALRGQLPPSARSCPFSGCFCALRTCYSSANSCTKVGLLDMCGTMCNGLFRDQEGQEGAESPGSCNKYRSHLQEGGTRDEFSGLFQSLPPGGDELKGLGCCSLNPLGKQKNIMLL